MKILPSWKEKRRYLLIKFEGKREKVIKEIKNSLLFLIGIVNYAKARPLFLKHQEYIILSVHRKYLSQAIASLLLCKSKPTCIYVSGTIKKIKRKIKEISKDRG
jgi:RNase P/RNase MRP subunit POP5